MLILDISIFAQNWRIGMRNIITIIAMLFASFVAYAQSTCISRCEDEVGVGDSRCPKICKNFPENGKRKKIEQKVDSNATISNSNSAPVSVTTTDQIDKKVSPPSPVNTQVIKEK
jgi:hypothetical protein